MQDIIQQIRESATLSTGNPDSVSTLYDQYAPALYGRILQVISQKEIAEKILERVFINALVDKNVNQNDHITFFNSLLNHSRKKSYSTLKALKMLQACSCDSSINSTGTK